MSGFKKIKKLHNGVPRQLLDGVMGVLWRIFILQGCFVKNLHIKGLESTFFLQGVNRNSYKLQRCKDILTLNNKINNVENI